MKKLITFVAVVALATPAFAEHGGIHVVSETDNGDGSITWELTVDTLNEVSFLEMWIEAPEGGSLVQSQAPSANYANFGPNWAPNIIFSSDSGVAGLTDAGVYNPDLDTFVDDSNWPGIVIADLSPNAGDASDGTQAVHIALTSFTGGVGGPLSGLPIPLAQVTFIPGDGLGGNSQWPHIVGVLQSDSDQSGEIHIPEPSTLALAGFGLMGLIAGMRRRS